MGTNSGIKNGSNMTFQAQKTAVMMKFLSFVNFDRKINNKTTKFQ